MYISALFSSASPASELCLALGLDPCGGLNCNCSCQNSNSITGCIRLSSQELVNELTLVSRNLLANAAMERLKVERSKLSELLLKCEKMQPPPVKDTSAHQVPVKEPSAETSARKRKK